jgi:putative addiction module component (TIGR02574 family)
MAGHEKSLDDLRKLPVDDRIRLVEQLWDSIAEDAVDADLPIEKEIVAELERRLAEHHRDPAAALPWDRVRERIRRLTRRTPG